MKKLRFILVTLLFCVTSSLLAMEDNAKMRVARKKIKDAALLRLKTSSAIEVAWKGLRSSNMRVKEKEVRCNGLLKDVKKIKEYFYSLKKDKDLEILKEDPVDGCIIKAILAELEGYEERIEKWKKNGF